MAIRIKAAPGQRVRDEQSNLLPDEGITLDKLTPYWVRRENDKEILVEESKAAPAPRRPNQDQ